ncbi:MAG: lipopolysaccharide biosynthesis protein [Clostridia bacterium]|nr:lipopolysaccharide biosynthesis protein [Clostridia bacterium]
MQSKGQRYAKLLRTIVISGGALLINSLVAFCLVPVISNTVGTEAYGFVSMAKTFEQYAMILTAALNAFAARYITIAYHENKLEEANTYFSSTLYGDVLLSTGLFSLAMAGIFFLDRFIRISPELVTDVKWLFVFIFVNFWLVTVSTAFTATAHVKNKLDVAGAVRILAYGAEAALLVFCFVHLRPSVHYVGLGRALQAAVLALGSLYIWRRYAPELALRRRYFSGRALRNLVSNGIWTSMNSLGGVLNDGLDLWICNLMLTPLGMGQLALAKTFHSLFGGMFSVISQAFEPTLLKSYATGDRQSLLDELNLGMKLSGMLSNILFAGFIALGMSFYRLWIPKEDIALVYGLTIISNLATVPSGPMFPLYYIYVLTAKNRFPTVMTIVGGLFNVGAMYLLLSTTNLGNYAILWTSVAVSVLIAFVSNPLYMAHVLREPWWTFYPGLLRNMFSCGVMVAVFYGLSRLYQPSSWITLILSALALFALGVVLHMLMVYNRQDRKKILRLLKRSRPSS